ncbi:MAG: AraC family transcriptional regulator [Solobacterium sp.]|nr:AraC family transcriptional regulator [Solobacterium sp.]
MKNNLRSEFNQRQKMLKDSYEIYFYSDSHFQSVLPHRHDYYEFYFPASGSIEMEISGMRTPLSYRDVVVVPPETVHRAVTKSEEGSYSRYVFWISRPWYEKLFPQADQCDYVTRRAKDGKYITHFTENEYTVIHSKLLRLMEEDRSKQYGAEAFARVCISDLIMTISRIAYVHDHPDRSDERTDLFRSIMEYIEQNLSEDLSLDTVADTFYVSKYHIAHIFKSRLGLSMHQYITKKRLERCASAIASGRQINRVYEYFGFKDYSAFFRAFKKEYGISPKDYQNVYLRDPRIPR